MHATRTLLMSLALPLVGARPFQSPDPPARVARVSYLQGDVSLRSDTLNDWARAVLNYPVTSGDNLWTGDGARAELQLGSTTMQLAPQTAFAAMSFDDQHTQASITQGSLAAHVREIGDDATVEFDTPSGAVSMVRPGDVRIDVSPDGLTTTVTVRHGQAELTASGNTIPISAGSSVTLSADGSGSSDVHPAAAPDEWEQWALERDRQQDAAASARYVSREMTGYADLDGYGTWRVVPAYGEVWVPRAVVAGWAPYRFGHWAWIEPWGWTWIDDAPWGFAPFHYGRWAYWSGGWVWVPGRVVARPVYAPALVAFVGGAGWSVRMGAGPVRAVGWFPLAPGEAYYPAYRVSPVYVRNVNVTTVRVTNINVTNVNVTNVRYINRGVPGAVTAVRGATFQSGQPVGGARLALAQRDLESAPLMGRAAPLAPRGPALRRVSEASAERAAAPPPAAESRRVVTRTGTAMALGGPPRVYRAATPDALRERGTGAAGAAGATGARSRPAPAPERAAVRRGARTAARGEARPGGSGARGQRARRSRSSSPRSSPRDSSPHRPAQGGRDGPPAP